MIKSLSINNLSYQYNQKKIFDDINFNLFSGEFTVLLGKNGAGKTTLFSLITSLLKIQTGQINVFDNCVLKNSQDALSKIGVVFQASTLDLDLTVEQNLYYFSGLQGFSRTQSSFSIKKVIEFMNLESFKNKKLRTMSGGERRRVEVSRAILNNPPLLLMDEATANLDIHTRKIVLEKLHDLVKEQKTSVLWSTHQVEEIEENDRTIILNKGKIIEDDKKKNLLKKFGKSIRDILLDLENDI
jgi:ABC-2 type transport system ATP-binding protein